MRRQCSAKKGGLPCLCPLPYSVDSQGVKCTGVDLIGAETMLITLIRKCHCGTMHERGYPRCSLREKIMDNIIDNQTREEETHKCNRSLDCLMSGRTKGTLSFVYRHREKKEKAVSNEAKQYSPLIDCIHPSKTVRVFWQMVSCMLADGIMLIDEK